MNYYKTGILLIMSFFFFQAGKAQDSINYNNKKHLFYIKSMVGVNHVHFRNDDSFMLELLNLNLGSQFYFKHINDSSRWGLDISYADYTISGGILEQGRAFSILQPGAVYSTQFERKESAGLDIKFNAGAIVVGTKDDGGYMSIQNSFGWSISTKFQFWKNHFTYGLQYRFADLDDDGMRYYQRFGFFLGARF